MRRTVLLLATVVLAMLLASGVALALPSETPDDTLMVNGPVRTFAQVGNNLWVGGDFTQVQRRDGTVVADVSDVAVFDSATGEYRDVAPQLGVGDATANVRDMTVYGGDVVIGGDFSGPTTTQKNLVKVDGSTGQLTGWYTAPKLQSVLAAPDLGRIYGGGVSLSAFDVTTGNKLWSRAQTFVDATLRSHTLAEGYRDLERDGSTIWAACACDAVAARDGSTNPAKALVKLDTEGNHYASWVANPGVGAFGISVAQTSNNLYLGAGGSDSISEHPKANNGTRSWLRDTSGSTQAVEVMDGQIVIGGHFVEVADAASDGCGFRSSDPNTLDPNDECQTRLGLAAYSFGGTLDPNWDPPLTGKYNLAWALHPDGTRLHVGGEFTKASGITNTYYARFSSNQDTTPPTVSDVSPAEGASRVALAANAQASFSEAMDASTISGSTFTLTRPDGAPVAAALSYDSTTKKATLNPTKNLAASTKYTARVKGGADGATDLAGDPLAADKVWSFTTKNSSR